MKKTKNNNGNKKNTILKTIASKFTQFSQSTSPNQKDLFNPELFLTIDKINEKFGNNTVGFGNNLGNVDFDKLLNSNDINLLQEKANELLKKYQQIDKQLIAYAKDKNTNANIYKKRQLAKQKEEIKKIYISVKQRIKDLY